MARRYDSFVLRRWELEGSDVRIEVEHVQSGRRASVGSMSLAVAWMDAAGDETPLAYEAKPETTG